MGGLKAKALQAGEGEHLKRCNLLRPSLDIRLRRWGLLSL